MEKITISKPLPQVSGADFGVFVIEQFGGNSDFAISYLEGVVSSLRESNPNKRLRPSDFETFTPTKSTAQVVVPSDYLQGDGVDSSQITLVIQVPEDMGLISHIIGRSGANINAIIALSGAKVQIERQGTRPSDSVRNIFFKGTLSSTFTAYLQLFERACEVSQGAFMEISRIVVPNELVGHIIGKGGQIIKELTDSARVAKIDVQHESEMNQRLGVGVYGRTVSILGDIGPRHHAVYLLLRQMCVDKILPELWKGDQPKLMTNAPSFGLAPPFSMNMGGGMAPQMMTSMAAPALGGGLTGSTGILNQFGMGCIPNPPTSPRPPHAGLNMQNSMNILGSKIKQIVKIPGDKGCIGMLIGPKGSHIDEMQRQTGCSIVIDKTSEVGEETLRNITIEGASIGQISMAVDLVTVKVNEWMRTHAMGHQAMGMMGHR